MKRVLITFILISVFLCNVGQAFDIISVSADKSFISSLNRNVEEDIQYLRNLAFAYGGKYVVTEEEYTDISEIDKFFEALSEPVSLPEIDKGELDFNSGILFSERLKREWTLFKLLGGLSGCSAEFEPVAYFRIYRNITLIGGYVHYSVSDEYFGGAYWQYICNIENMTKEIVPYESRLKLLEKTKQMYDNIGSDDRFKVFLLFNGKINSVWERGAG